MVLHFICIVPLYTVISTVGLIVGSMKDNNSVGATNQSRAGELKNSNKQKTTGKSQAYDLVFVAKKGSSYGYFS